jgi:hypothetical protein
MGAGRLETLLDAVQGDPQAPAIICAGDLLLLMDIRTARGAFALQTMGLP